MSSLRTLLALSGPCAFPLSTLCCPCPGGKYKVEMSEDSGSTSNCMICGHDFLSHSDLDYEGLVETSSGSRYTVRSSTHPNPFEIVGPLVEPEELSPRICNRFETIQNIYKELKSQRILHVRGTPTSGKTTLGLLLEKFINRYFPEMEVIFLTWPGNLSKKENNMPYRYTIEEYHRIQFPTDPREMSNLVLIIDEAQRSYKHFALWNNLIKYQGQGNESGAYIVLLSSYGSPSQHVHEYDDETWTPPYLSDQQRISMRPLASNNQNVSLYFVRAEFNDVIRRAAPTDSRFPVILSEDSIDELFRLTCGHAGCTSAFLEVIKHSNHSSESRRGGKEITVEILYKIMRDPDFFNSLKSSKGFGRCLPKLQELQNKPAWALVLQHVVAAGHVKRKSVEDDALNFIYKKGWLHAELDKNTDDSIYICPTNIHHMYYAKLLCLSTKRFPTQMFPSLGEFWRAVVQKFSRSALVTHCHSIGAGGLPRPMETQYGDEFYRSAWQLLGNGSFLTSEWGDLEKIKDSTNRINFVVRDVKWGIELMRDGEHPSRHLDRFKPGGQYYDWIANNRLAEWVVLDFRCSMPRISHRREIFHVVFTDEHRDYKIIDGFGHVCDGPIRLLDEAEVKTESKENEDDDFDCD
ncbi:hypothetical protein EDC01DRAFT_651929 [Geopyxis carbonaria]|nr:hypothetical protein EDC01DRAFT_651929 [Geopyxis carbonaria]